jgi:hypothetical protein
MRALPEESAGIGVVRLLQQTRWDSLPPAAGLLPANRRELEPASTVPGYSLVYPEAAAASTGGPGEAWVGRDLRLRINFFGYLTPLTTPWWTNFFSSVPPGKTEIASASVDRV